MKERKECLEQAKSQDFDLVVIGAGVTGAGIAQNAAARGLAVLLVDKADFASGASSKTSQLVHGSVPIGQLHIKQNRQTSEEHERLKRLAPHLIKEIPFVFPLLHNNTLFNLKASAGLTINEMLSISTGHLHTSTHLSKKKLANLVPAISTKLITGGIQFHEAITDDSRFVLSVIKAAQAKGASTLNYVQASGFRIEGGKITGVTLRDRYSGNEFMVACKVCVNASGVWSDEVNSLLPGSAGSQLKQRVLPSKGTQIIVSGSAFEVNNAVLLPAKDGQFVYILPWHHALLIGTAESSYKGDYDQTQSTRDEIDYLLSVVNGYTDTHKLGFSDVRSCFSAAKAQINTSANQGNLAAAPEHAIFESMEGLYSVFGGKFDSYRIIADELMDKIAARCPGLCKKAARTAQDMLGGWESKEDFLARSSMIETKARRLGIEPASIQHLLTNYGAEAEHVVDLVEKKESFKERIISDFPPILAELPYAVISEMTVSLQDFMLRRNRLGMLNQKLAIAAAPRIAELMASLLNWDSYRTKVEIEALETELVLPKAEANTVSI